jgi:mono/diheme cytochrome c family protein
VGPNQTCAALAAAAVLLCAAAACTTPYECGGFDYGDAGYEASAYDWDSDCGFCWEDGGPVTTTSAIRPTFLPTVTAATPPPPISGGTLIVSTDGRYAIAADPDRDAVYIVDLTGQTPTATTPLSPGDEPGRLVEDGAGRVHVALRGGGALVTLDSANGAVLYRRQVCPAPRGVDWDSSTDLVWVACATGELVGLPASGGAASQSLVVERDLRDVIASNGSLSVSSFRSAAILRLAGDGSITRRDHQPLAGMFAPHVAWRMARGPSSTLVVAHQLESTADIPTKVAGAYGGCNGGIPLPPPSNSPTDGGDADGGACAADALGNFTNAGCDEQPGVVVSALTVLGADGSVVTSRMFPAALPVDVAVSRDGSMFGVAAAGDAFVEGLGSVFWFTACGDFARPPVTVGKSHSEQAVAVAFDAANDLLVQTREPAELWILPLAGPTRSIALSSVTRDDTGHDVFHAQAGAMIACASCHPEGQDDSNTWTLDSNLRRTPSLRGTIGGTAPYHWPGDEPTLAALVGDVYTTRMNGEVLADGQEGALATWVQNVPAPPAPSWVDTASAARGQTLFTSSTIGCSGCHAGAKLTNNMTLDVGTGGAFQVPPLMGVGWRAPLLHNGCAATLADRFGACATPQHGQISSLTQANIADLVSYLETL